jgi:ABC-2 type transport system ATP-binding protein
MIEIKGLTKKYGKLKAVDHISFEVLEGEILGFLGPNGAGKTTTMNIITGYLSATHGSVKVDGFDVLEKPNEVKSRIGYLPETPPLYNDMTVYEYLDFVYEIKKVKSENKKEHIESIKGRAKIDDVSGRIIKNLSKGYKQRVGLAQALIGDPKVLVLDEPTIGLDPKQIIEFRNTIKELGKSHTVILSSHILPEISAVCDKVVIINRGKIVAIDTTENLSKSNENNLLVTIEGDKGEVIKVINKIKGVALVSIKTENLDGTCDYIVQAEAGVDIRKFLFVALAKNNFPVVTLRQIELSLEDIFLQVVTEEKFDEEIETPEVGNPDAGAKAIIQKENMSNDAEKVDEKTQKEDAKNESNI